MGTRLFDEEERKRRAIAVAEYIMETGSSTRATAKFFTENYFSISNATVSDYCDFYKNNYGKRAAKLQEVINANKVKTTDDIEVKERIYNNIKLYLKGYTIEEISENTNNNYWVIYRDLTERISKLDKELYEQIKNIMSERKNRNLKK